MAGIDIITIWTAISFVFLIVGYAVKNQVFASVGAFFMLILSIILLASGYEVQSGVTSIADYTYDEEHLLSNSSTTETWSYTTIKDQYTYAFGAMMLAISLFILYQSLVGRL